MPGSGGSAIGLSPDELSVYRADFQSGADRCAGQLRRDNRRNCGETFLCHAVAQHGLAQCLMFQPGDFFQDSLPSVDVLVMGHILHDWTLEQKKLLLCKASDALPSGGAL